MMKPQLYFSSNSLSDGLFKNLYAVGTLVEELFIHFDTHRVDADVV